MWEGGGRRSGRGEEKKETLPRLFDGNFANEKTMTGRQSQESEQIVLSRQEGPQKGHGGGRGGHLTVRVQNFKVAFLTISHSSTSKISIICAFLS